jgi:outer membrane lipoprotein-sorting protein
MKKFLILFAFIFLAAGNANAFTSTEKELLAKAQRYFDNLKTMQGGFIQLESETSEVVRGEIYVSKPGKLLMRYAEPYQADFYLVGGRLMVYDHELDQLNHTDADNTPFNIFLQPNFKLDSNLLLKVKAVENQINKYTIRLEPIKLDENSTKEVSLEFSKFNDEVIGFERMNDKGNKFIITFVNVKTNEPINEKVFVFRDPRKDRKYPTSR